MKLVKAYASKETVTIELTFDEFMIITDTLLAETENREDDELFLDMSSEFDKLADDLLVLHFFKQRYGK